MEYLNGLFDVKDEVHVFRVSGHIHLKQFVWIEGFIVSYNYLKVLRKGGGCGDCSDVTHERDGGMYHC